MATRARELLYVIGEKENIAFVFFVGKISGKSIELMRECSAELKRKAHRAVILVFRDVAAISADAFIEFVQFQTSIRESGKILILSSLTPKLKSDLLFPGIIRDSDTFNNLQEALDALRAM